MSTSEIKTFDSNVKQKVLNDEKRRYCFKQKRDQKRVSNALLAIQN